jgi:2-C-methyl-D-erythritol 4-phosphate cytidylyltransferase
VETLDRTCLVAIQTPQGFLARALRHAHESLDEATDDATLVEACGFEVVVIPGEVSNRKITDPVDFEFCASLIRARESI